MPRYLKLTDVAPGDIEDEVREHLAREGLTLNRDYCIARVREIPRLQLEESCRIVELEAVFRTKLRVHEYDFDLEEAWGEYTPYFTQSADSATWPKQDPYYGKTKEDTLW